MSEKTMTIDEVRAMLEAHGFSERDALRMIKEHQEAPHTEKLLGELPEFSVEERDDYAALQNVLLAAYRQASQGKGKERHGNGLAFEDQPMQTISGLLGTDGGMAFQAIKKIIEARKLPTKERRVNELLGAINYIAGMVVYEERTRDA